MFASQISRFAVLILLLVPVMAPAADFIWIEGEEIAEHPDGGADKWGYRTGPMGPAEMFAGRSSVSWQYSGEKAAEDFPEEGVVFAWRFEADRDGRRDLWMRLGYEWIRSNFDWRLDGGKWRTVSNDEALLDLQEPATFVSLGWLKVGAVDLAAGKHTLQLRHKPSVETDGKGREKPTRTLFLLDAVLLTDDQFRPNGPHKPGADYKAPIDRRAAETVFELPGAESPAHRTSVKLSGVWEYARWDELDPQPETRLAGDTSLPDLDRLFWYGIEVPSERNAARPEFNLAHRSIYRTRVDVPDDYQGRGFMLEFEQFSMVASVFVNGIHCGASKNMYARWACDVSKAIRPGQVNQIAVVIKDPYYAIDPSLSNKPLVEKYGLRAFYRVPVAKVTMEAICRMVDMPINVGADNLIKVGLWEPVHLVTVGPVYTEDAFAKPSVAREELGLELTLRNPADRAVAVTVENRIRPWSDSGLGQVEKTFAPATVKLAAGEEKVVKLTEKWADPDLWWPDDPNLYVVETVIKREGKEIDRKHTRFGFRQWEWTRGDLFMLNGRPWQVYGDLNRTPDPADFPAFAHRRGSPIYRFWRAEGWGGKTRREIMDIMDEGGVIVRDSALWDGQVGNYGMGLVETIDGERTYRRSLISNIIDQARAWVRANRNHPSIMIWSLENEVTYINAGNRGMSEEFEPGMRIYGEAVMETDPTRPVMIDGANALRPPSEWEGVGEDVKALGHLPVNGAHYLEDNPMGITGYPDDGYHVKDFWGGDFRQRGKWPVLMDRPTFHGEYFFGNGWSTGKLAVFGGEDVYMGVPQRKATRSLIMRMMTEGLRWSNGTAAWHFWDSGAGPEAQQKVAYSPIAVLVREWNWSFAGGDRIGRTLKVLNQTSSDAPIRWRWSLEVGGKTVASDEATVSLPIGGRTEPISISFETPKVSRRTSGTFNLEAFRNGRRIFHDAKQVWLIVPEGTKPRREGRILVLDPEGEVKARLKDRGIGFTAVRSAQELMDRDARLIVIGRDAIGSGKASDVMWQHLVLSGTNVLVLEQEHPLHYRSLPADFEPTTRGGSIMFPQDLAHPVFDGLGRADFFCWSDGHRSYKNAYRKAQRGARSLLHGDIDLSCTMLSQCRLGDRVMVLCQALVGQKLATDPVARRLFDNMLRYSMDYEAVRKDTAVVLPEGSGRGQLLDQIRLQAEPAEDPLAALDAGQIAIVDATSENLRRLVDAKDRVRQYTGEGGWLMLWGLTPQGLATFNNLVGVDHLIRPFTMERVDLAMPRHSLAAGLGARDVVMEAERLWRWSATMWMSDDEFSYVVDLDDVAPFATINGLDPETKPARTSAPRNVVNGYTRQKHWKFIYFIDISDGEPAEVTFDLPHQETLTALDIIPNAHYRKPRELRVEFDNDPSKTFTFEIEPAPERQSLELPRPVDAEKVRLILEDFAPDEGRPVAGFENVWLFAKRSDTFREKVQPLLNIGGLVAYPSGKGGILLNQLNVPEVEENPENAPKRAAIMRTVLSNLHATFGGAQVVVPGAPNVRYEPIAIDEARFNAYSLHGKDPGWFRDRRAGDATLTGLKTGRQTLAGVDFKLQDLMTSPTRSVIMLAGDGSKVQAEKVQGIEIGRKAQALFFLHTYHEGRRTARWRRQLESRPDRAETDPVVFRYRVNYADGQNLDVPVVLDKAVGHWLQADPGDLKHAALATAQSAPDHRELKICLYAMQWTNPRPGVAIQSVDLLPGTVKNAPQWGAPALIGITAARTREP